MKKLLIFAFATLFTLPTFAIKVTAMGSGGAKISHNDGKIEAHICPQKADSYCATLEITGDDIKIIAQGMLLGPNGGGDTGDKTWELVSHTEVAERVWEDVILIEK